MQLIINIVYIIQKLLLVTTAGLLIYAGMTLMKPLPAPDVSISTDAIQKAPQPPVADMTAYMAQNPQDVITTRDVFSSVEMPTDLLQTSTSIAGTLPGNFKIVGIVIGKPSEIIIEDSATRQTYFLKESERAAGIEVERFKGQEVLLKYQGQGVSVPLQIQ